MSAIRFLLACVLVAATFALLEFGAFLNSARLNGNDIRARADAVQIDAHRLILQTAALESQASDSLAKLDDAETQQAKYWAHLELKTGVAIGNLNGVALRMQDLVSHTDLALNSRPDGILPTLQGTAISVDNGVQMYTTSTQPVIDETAQAMHKFEQAMTAVSEIADDESWQHIPQNLDALTTSAMEASGNINATSVDVRQAVHDYIHPRWPMKLLNGIKDVSDAIPTALKLVF